MQINAIIKPDAEELSTRMLLDSSNSTDPQMWGAELYYVNNQASLVIPNGIPEEFDFFSAWCNKDPINAKKYYETFR